MGEYVLHKGGQRHEVDASSGGVIPVEKVARDLDYVTPEKVLAPVRAYFGGQIPLDPCTNPTNPTRALTYYTPAEDGLAIRWHAGAYVNPPYGTHLRAWLAKMIEEAALDVTILALIPASRFEQRYAQDFWCAADALCMVRGRVAFLRPSTGQKATGNPYASLLFGFNVDWTRFGACFGALGRCIQFEERTDG